MEINVYILFGNINIEVFANVVVAVIDRFV